MKTNTVSSPAKKFAKGTVVKVWNRSYDGTPFYEGPATVVKHLYGDYCRVRFANSDLVDRFIDPEKQ